MVSSSEVTTDKQLLDTLVTELNGIVDGLNPYWRGSSYSNFSNLVEEFVTDYVKKVSSQLDYFNQAVLVLTNYDEADKFLKKAKSNLDLAKDANDLSKVNKAKSDISKLTGDKTGFSEKLKTLLDKAKTPKLEASSMEYNPNVPKVPAAISLIGASSTSGTGVVGATGTTGSYTNLDMTNYSRGDGFEDGLSRSVLVAKYLVEHGGFTKEQAAALAGVYLDENNCDPGEVMEAEKASKSYYGAGIGSWTFGKEETLADAGLSTDTLIESLTLQQQCDLIIAESQNSKSLYYNALKRCNSVEDASATAVVMVGGPAYCSNWETGHATPAEAKAMSDWYGQCNDASFGASDYHWNLDVRRLDYAKQILSQM